MAEEEAVLTERRGRVMIITLNRPDAMNAILDVWLSTEFEAGRHVRRVEKIDAMGSCC